ncbi:hypothetical protein [Fodinibius sp. AD559]|uniref:hypothetical protein n=1 Tax=Fodinibius sp. AD559 TaxID=3424179 RepID=UPI0040468B05
MKGIVLASKIVFLAIFGGILCLEAEAVSTFNTIPVQHQKPTLIERNNPFELRFSAPSINANEVADAYLFHKTDGEMGFRQKQVALVSSSFLTELTIEDAQANELEYYLQIHLNNGETITYPSNDASGSPIRVEIVDPQKSERKRRIEETGVDYTILSPDPGTAVSQQDVVVALTLFYDPIEIDTSGSFRMYIDGKDITEQANASDYFYTYSPDDLSMGEHTAEFKIEKKDSAIVLADWNFSVVVPGQTGNASTRAQERQSWMPQGNVELRARNQQVGGYPNDALSGNIRISGQKGDISYSAFGLLTTQEDPRLQPQNRYGLNLYVDNWLELEAGHVYPILSTYTIAGQRIQGVNAGFRFWDETLNLQLIYGKLRRGIDNIYDEISVEEQAIGGAQDPVRSYTLNTDEGGTFRRKIAGGRIGFKKGDRFNIGINVVKVEDDTSSIRLIDDFNDVMAVDPGLANNLNNQYRQELENNPDKLGVRGNPTPRGNFVAAADIKTRFDNNRIQFEADGAVSLLNQDISEGTLTQQAADRIGFNIAEDTENMLDRLSWLIIINENMETLPIRFDEGATNTSAEVFFPTSILAGQSQLGFSYFNNDLWLRYRWVGPGYNSLANRTIRKDIAGFSLRDRVRLFENQIYLTLGYENLHDNVINNRDATTSTINYRGNISWYPSNQDLPRVSLGMMKRTRDNEVGLNNPLVASMVGTSERAAVQNLVIQNEDTLSTPTPRLSDTYQFTASVSKEFSLMGTSHDASINYSLLNTADQVFEYGDSQSHSISFRVVNRFQNYPLQTNIGFNYNNSETSGGLSDVKILGANVGGSLFLFDDKLNIEMSLAFTQNRSESIPLVISNNDTPQLLFDDYYIPGPSANGLVTESNSFMINTRTRYNLSERHSFLLDFKYSNVRNVLSSSITYPNDHLLQLRYIFNF